MIKELINNTELKTLLNKYENKRPEIVFEWKDKETEAEGWVVINSLRGGAAGGGTRMRKGLDRHEVESLAKTMEIKFTVSGPPIGGAKSGINFDPSDPRKKGVLERWYKAVYPLLKNYYGTGGDLNVDEINEVIPITERYGLLHPQEGVVHGHLKLNEEDKMKRILQLREGVSKLLDDERYSPDLSKLYTVADMITGYGVAEAVKHYYNTWGGKIKGKRAIIQGWGNVGGAAAYYLAQMGVKVVGIIDHKGGMIHEKGYEFEEVRDLFIGREENMLVSEDLRPFEEINEKIWNLEAEIFIPAASSRLLTMQQCEAMAASGLEVMSCGANVPFADPEIFFGPIADYIDSEVSVIPDFIANCGMARVFAYLMQDGINITDEAIFQDISTTIKSAMLRLQQFNPKKTGLSKKALEMSLTNLV